jgi:thiol-disulfide isomerase/thioredoxin
MKLMTRRILMGAIILALVLLGYWYFKSSEGFEGADTFTLYYADWCPHCKTIKPVFSEWSSKKSIEVKGKTVFLSMVEADTEPEKVSAAGVKGYPTFMLKKADGTSVEFNGERSPSGWESWLKSNL